MAPAPLSTGFQSFTPLPTIKLGPSGAGSPVDGLVHTLGPCGSLQRPLPRGWESLLLPPQPPRALSIRGLPGLHGLLHSPPCVQFICAQMWGRGVLPATLPALFSATLSLALSVYLCECGAAGSAGGQTACPVHPTLRQSRPATATRVLSAPAAHLRPSYRSG